MKEKLYLWISTASLSQPYSLHYHPYPSATYTEIWIGLCPTVISFTSLPESGTLIKCPLFSSYSLSLPLHPHHLQLRFPTENQRWASPLLNTVEGYKRRRLDHLLRSSLSNWVQWTKEVIQPQKPLEKQEAVERHWQRWRLEKGLIYGRFFSRKTRCLLWQRVSSRGQRSLVSYFEKHKVKNTGQEEQKREALFCDGGWWWIWEWAYAPGLSDTYLYPPIVPSTQASVIQKEATQWHTSNSMAAHGRYVGGRNLCSDCWRRKHSQGWLLSWLERSSVQCHRVWAQVQCCVIPWDAWPIHACASWGKVYLVRCLVLLGPVYGPSSWAGRISGSTNLGDHKSEWLLVHP